MEDNTTLNTNLLNPIINVIDNAINKKYPSDSGFFSIFNSPLTEKNFFDIINIIINHSSTPSVELINELTSKNSHCKQAIEHFNNLARQNIDNVTIDTLEAIQNPTLQQPIAQLNQLPPIIKQLIMESEYSKIKPSYNISLKGHTRAINFFDICPQAHLAATSSWDQTLRLWDLKTGNLIHMFSGTDNTVDCMSFNKEGSHLATAKLCGDRTSSLNIWDTQSGKHLQTIKVAHRIATLNYANNTIITCEEADYLPTITVFSVTKDTIDVLHHTDLPRKSSFPKESMCTYWYKGWSPYKGNNPYYQKHNFKSTLTIAKQTDSPLYLCERIVANTPQLSSNQIKQQSLFQQLTEYEQKIITASLQKSQNNKLLTNK